LNHVPLSYTNGKTRKDNMSELVKKTAIENGDWPEFPVHQVPSFKEYCKKVLGKDLYKKVMSNPMPLSNDGTKSIIQLYADYRKLIGKPFSSNVTD